MQLLESIVFCTCTSQPFLIDRHLEVLNLPPETDRSGNFSRNEAFITSGRYRKEGDWTVVTKVTQCRGDTSDSDEVEVIRRPVFQKPLQVHLRDDTESEINPQILEDTSTTQVTPNVVSIKRKFEKKRPAPSKHAKVIHTENEPVYETPTERKPAPHYLRVKMNKLVRQQEDEKLCNAPKKQKVSTQKISNKDSLHFNHFTTKSGLTKKVRVNRKLSNVLSNVDSNAKRVWI